MKFITKLRQDLKEYLFEIFEINKVFNQLDNISYRLIEVESDVRDLNECDILNYGPEDFVESGELDDIRSDLDEITNDLSALQTYDLDEMDIAIDKLSNSVEDLQEEVKSYRFEQVKLRRAMRALCMSLGRDDILNILEASEDE